ncbi:MFS transporter [Avibacterium endocarditidis]|uniref:MFS transporter n=1 Tax=Avibacterium TaxID=292486 RepID=UPI0039FDD7A9
MKNRITLFSLFLGQGLTNAIISLLTLTSIFVGKNLSPMPELISLPITATVFGNCIMVFFAGNLMEKYGRKRSFIMSGWVAFLGAIIGIFSLYVNSFLLFLISTFVLGNALGFSQYYRFAAGDITDDKVGKKKATSIVISGGILGGILGPYLAQKGEFLIDDSPFLGNLIFTLVIAILIVISQKFVFLSSEVKPITNISERKNLTLFNNHTFILATLTCSISFSLMVLIMNAAPLSLHHHYPNEDNVMMIQLHFVSMYLPSLFLPFLITKIKTANILLLGILFFLIGSLSAIFFNNYFSYLLPLIFSGLGWAFMFNAGTYYLNEVVENKYKIQKVSTIITYLCNLASSFSVGLFLMYNRGWILINVLVVIMILLFFILWLKYRPTMK